MTGLTKYRKIEMRKKGFFLSPVFLFIIALALVMLFLLGPFQNFLGIIGSVYPDWHFSNEDFTEIKYRFSEEGSGVGVGEPAIVSLGNRVQYYPAFPCDKSIYGIADDIILEGSGKCVQPPNSEWCKTHSCPVYRGIEWSGDCLQGYLLNYCDTLGGGCWRYGPCSYNRVSGCVCQLRDFHTWYLSPESYVNIKNIDGDYVNVSVDYTQISGGISGSVSVIQPDIPKQSYMYTFNIVLQKEKPEEPSTYPPTLPDIEKPEPIPDTPEVPRPIPECSVDDDCKACGAQCINNKCVYPVYVPPPSCAGAVWKDYPDCEMDTSGCLKLNWFDRFVNWFRGLFGSITWF